ncbi:glycosyltransferase family 4 protein [Candidatus Kaiserbacteria bacterium]|nr:glycosyltransferase family 4 protein [Candidatus Kaiserbacteria bacterium]
MKILVYFSGKLNEPRGTPIRTRNQIKELTKNGFDVFYAGHDVPEGFAPERVLMLAPPLRRFGQLARFVREEGIAIVYMQTSAGIWYAPWLRFFTSAKVGIDFHSRRYQEEHVYKKRATALTAVLEWLELFLARSLHFGTAVSHTIRDYYLHSVPRFLVLPVGVDTTLFSSTITPRPDVALWKGNATLLGYAGNTKWYQGVEDVLEAFRKAVKARSGAFKFLVIASSGSEDVEKYAKEHGIGNDLMILDKQPHAEIPTLLAAADILTVVRPSDPVTEYSFPSKLPEYAALGKALIVSRVSDIGSYIKNGENGMIVAPGDAAALERALLAPEDAFS